MIWAVTFCVLKYNFAIENEKCSEIHGIVKRNRKISRKLAD